LSIEASGTAVDGDDGARCSRRASTSSNPRLSVYADVFFPQHLVLTLPPLPPPQAQFVFESRFGVHDVLNDCTMTVNGTDFCIPQKGAATKENAFTSHKYAAGGGHPRREPGMDPGVIPCQ